MSYTGIRHFTFRTAPDLPYTELTLKGHSKTRTSGKRLRVLIADDSEAVRKSLERLLRVLPNLELVGHAADGLQALEAVDLLEPDVLILDMRMPELTGLEVLKKLKAIRHQLCIIVFTGESQEHYREECLAAGADHFFEKGSQTMDLVEALKGLTR